MKFIGIFICLVLGYLLGSINPAILVSHFKGEDIRKKGSGNAGATNTLRTYGKAAALIVTLGDAAKCVLSVLLAMAVMALTAPEMTLYGKIAAAAGCILGHLFPLYFGFRGGKGVLTAVTAVLMLDVRVGLIALAVFILAVLLSSYVSLGSILGAASAIVSAMILAVPPVKGFTLAAGMMVIIRHRANIGRLIAGTEAKTSFGKKKE